MSVVNELKLSVKFIAIHDCILGKLNKVLIECCSVIGWFFLSISNQFYHFVTTAKQGVIWVCSVKKVFLKISQS